MVNNYRNTKKNLRTLFLLLALFTVSSLVSSASLSSFKPSFDSIESTVVRKEVFFNYLLPAIQKKNAEIVADRILLIDKGSLVAEGTHQNLLLSSKLYKRLCELQFNH